MLAIGGVGGLAIGLAGREILENLFTGLIILSTSPFVVGDEVKFSPPRFGFLPQSTACQVVRQRTFTHCATGFSCRGSDVEGIVVDVGWYRTTIRSFEREIYNIPNSVFSRNIVLNITRKLREWRFYEQIGARLTPSPGVLSKRWPPVASLVFYMPLIDVGVRVEDISKVSNIVGDMRRLLRQDTRIIQKLHRRVFMDKITRDQATIYLSCYVEAPNRDAFMAVKQDLLLSFVDCVERNGGKLARNRLQVGAATSLVVVYQTSALLNGVLWAVHTTLD